MPQRKGTPNKIRRKSKQLPAELVVEECQRRFRDSVGRDWTDADRQRVLDLFFGEGFGVRAPREVPKGWPQVPPRSLLMFGAMRDGREFLTGEESDRGTPLDPGDVAILSFLVRFDRYVPAAHAGRSASDLIDDARTSLVKARAAVMKAGQGLSVDVLAEVLTFGAVRQASDDIVLAVEAGNGRRAGERARFVAAMLPAAKSKA